MRILIYNIINVNPFAGGVERVLDILIFEFLKRGINIDIVYLSKIDNSTIDNRIAQLLLPETDGGSQINQKYLVKLLNERKYSLVYNVAAIYNRSSRCITEACIITHTPMVCVYHNSLDMHMRMCRMTNWMFNYRFLSKFARYILHLVQNLPYYKGANWISQNSVAQVVLSDSYIKDFIRIIDTRPSKLMSIKNPLPYNIKNCEDEKENIILFVGRLERQKNIIELLSIWREIHIDSWKFVILGDGSLKSDIKRQIIEYNLENRVVICEKSEPELYYRKAKIFVMTSLYEGYPMTLIECQAFGVVPIIYDSFTAAKEIIKDGYNGFLIPNYNKLLFINKLTKIMNDEYLRVKMSNASLNSVVDHNSTLIAMKWISLFNSIIKA